MTIMYDFQHLEKKNKQTHNFFLVDFTDSYWQ